MKPFSLLTLATCSVFLLTSCSSKSTKSKIDPTSMRGVVVVSGSSTPLVEGRVQEEFQEYNGGEQFALVTSESSSLKIALTSEDSSAIDLCTTDEETLKSMTYAATGMWVSLTSDSATEACADRLYSQLDTQRKSGLVIGGDQLGAEMLGEIVINGGDSAAWIADPKSQPELNEGLGFINDTIIVTNLNQGTLGQLIGAAAREKMSYGIGLFDDSIITYDENMNRFIGGGESVALVFNFTEAQFNLSSGKYENIRVTQLGRNDSFSTTTGFLRFGYFKEETKNTKAKGRAPITNIWEPGALEAWTNGVNESAPGVSFIAFSDYQGERHRFVLTADQRSITFSSFDSVPEEDQRTIFSDVRLDIVPVD